MRLIRASVVALLLCTPAAVLAAEGTAPPPAATDGEAPPEKPKKVCRMETSTGSVMPKRVCRTAAQTTADQEAAQRTREQMNRNRGM